MSRFLQALHSGRVLLMDGAMGTELQRLGMPPDACYELWNLTQPEHVRAIHQTYRDVGATCFLTNTFQGNGPAFHRHGLALSLAQSCNQAAVEIARTVAEPDGFVLASLGPMGDASLEWPIQHLLEIIPSLSKADAILLETSSSWDVVTAIAEITRQARPCLPVLLSLTFAQHEQSGDLLTRSGHQPEAFARVAASLGIAALGVNCGRDVSMEQIGLILRRYRTCTHLPLFARPNAGTPTNRNGTWIYPHTPSAMAACLAELLASGVYMVGGCCGTTPSSIAAFRPLVAAWNGEN